MKAAWKKSLFEGLMGRGTERREKIGSESVAPKADSHVPKRSLKCFGPVTLLTASGLPL